MSQRNELTMAIKNNRPALIIGKAGTAKTATVHKIATELGFPVETLLLAGILPEDLGGLVRPDNPDNPTSFKYLAPEWAIKHGNDPFVLFLDEINQASIQTLHALFYLVNDRKVAGVHLPNMRVIAAGNGADENEFLTPLPAPLLDRFVYRIKWRSDLKESLAFLSIKYKHLNGAAECLIAAVKKTQTDGTTPRHVEQMLMLIEDGTDSVERGRELVGAAYEVYLKEVSAGARHKEDDRLNELRLIADRIKSGSNLVMRGGIATRMSVDEMLENLSPEEKEMVLNAAA